MNAAAVASTAAASSAAAAPSTPAIPAPSVLSRLLRSPGDIAAACREDRDLGPIAATALASIGAGAAAFGGVLGSYRGGVQIAFASLKVPLALLFTLALCAPGFHALAATLGRPWPLRTVVALSLAAAGRAALALLAFAPVLWLLIDFGVSYHGAAVLAALAYATAGLAALGVLLRAGTAGGTAAAVKGASPPTRPSGGATPGSVLVALSFVGLFFAVGGQTSWILRPYLVRPRTEAPPFLRAREGGFADAVMQSSRSAAGIYDEPDVREVQGPTSRVRGEVHPGEERRLDDETLHEQDRRAIDNHENDNDEDLRGQEGSP